MIAGLFVLAPDALPQNRVLELDGQGSYVELPPNIFRDLAQATVEVWAKWDSFRGYSRVFEFGAAWQSMSIFNHLTNNVLRFNLYPESARNNQALAYQIRINRLLRTNEWIHLAAVSGPGGMRLYTNGVLAGTHTNAASFADIQVGQTNLFGRGVVRNPTDEDFQGQLDEIRVWNHRRTEAQIREFMRRRLTGNEPGLIGLWNFDDGTARDCGPNAFRGKLVGNARVVTPDLPAAAQLVADEPPLRPISAPPPVAAAEVTAARDFVAWWIAGALTLIAGLLAWFLLTLKRRGTPSVPALPGMSDQRLLEAGKPGALVQSDVKERALAELTQFAKESLVQGLYSQRNSLLQTQRQAQEELARLETRLVSLGLPDRIQAYENRIAELEKELATRSGEVRELMSATLLLMRKKLEQEKHLELTSRRSN